MNITIFDVEHGFFALLVSDRGRTIIFDCGHNPHNWVKPAIILPALNLTAIDGLFVSNYDEDHVSGLKDLQQAVFIRTLFRNQSVSVKDLCALKQASGGIGPGMNTLLGMISEYSQLTDWPVELDDLEIKIFYNEYPIFRNTNDLSMVTFVHYKGISIVFPGDLEMKSWDALMCNPYFISNLKKVNIFIAAHHGRIDGLCNNVFKICNPDVIIISDEPKKYNTQDANYTDCAIGIIGPNGAKRSVLSTRKDGLISIQTYTPPVVPSLGWPAYGITTISNKNLVAGQVPTTRLYFPQFFNPTDR